MSVQITKYINFPSVGTVTIPVNDYTTKYVIAGDPSLVGDVNFELPSPAKEGSVVDLIYSAKPILNDNKLIIFGVDISNIAKKNCLISAVFIGGTWKISLTNQNQLNLDQTPVDTPQLKNKSVTSEKLKEEAVTLPKIEEDLRTSVFTYLYNSNNSAKDAKIGIYIPFKYKISSVSSSCIEAMNTDELRYNISILNSTPVYSDTINLTVSAGNVNFINFTNDPIFESPSAGFLYFNPSKNTAGGMVLFTFVVKRIQ